MRYPLPALAALLAACASPTATPDAARDVSSEAAADAVAEASLVDQAIDTMTQDTLVADASADAAPDAMPDVMPTPHGRPVETVVPAHARWRYLDDDSDPGAAWKTMAFDDAAWREGPARLGFGEGDEQTVVRSGPNATSRPITTYFRRTFTVSDFASVIDAQLWLQRDDGAVVYLNGREVRRSNMPAGAVTRTTLARSTIGGEDEFTFEAAPITPTALREGANVIAVEVHQSAANSSDLSFNLELAVRRAVVDTSGDPTALAVGDIATCAGTWDEATGRLVDTMPGAVMLLGDTVYERGTMTEFRTCFEPSWGRHRARFHPAVGNHEYGTAGATGYYDYFGARAGDRTKGYYSYELGAWHVVVLNSNCGSIGGCGAGSAQERWLRADLMAHPTRCTLAYWHHPRFSSGEHGDDTAYTSFWTALSAAGVDLILVGHDHDYERFAPMNAAGNINLANGIRQLVVGTGGAYLRPFSDVSAHNVARSATVHGVMSLALRSTSYEWDFQPIVGDEYVDVGHAECH